MDFKTIDVGQRQITEIISPDILLSNDQDALDIIGSAPSEFLVLHEHNFEAGFFDLSTRKLGGVLQKFTNYRIKLAIIGNFDAYTSRALKDFIYESNKHGEYLFVSSMDEVVKYWKK